MASTPATLLKVEDVQNLPEKSDVWRYELVDGEVAEVSPAGMIHTLIVGRFYRFLADYADAQDAGLVIVDGLGFVLQRDPDTLRMPHISFISQDRLPAEGPTWSYTDVVPDIAIEVVSPSNAAAELRRRTRDYLDAGVRLLWVVWPDEQSVTVYSKDRAVIELGPADVLEGEDILPGFEITVAELFDISW